MKMSTILALLAMTGCGATGAEIMTGVTTLTGVACTLAADQTGAEPGWEIWACQVLDPNSLKPVGPSFQVKKAKSQAMKVTP